MVVKEFECFFVIDCMWFYKLFDFVMFGNVKLGRIKMFYFGKFVGDSFVGGDIIKMFLFDYEWMGSD